MSTEIHRNELQLLTSLTELCEAIVWEKPADESWLFMLPQKKNVPPQIVKIAEILGLMLIKLELKEEKNLQLLDNLHAKDAELEIIKNILTEKNINLNQEIQQNYQSQKIIGQCKAMKKVLSLAKTIAKNPINTLILGPTGSGKEIIAKMIHYNSSRANGPFIAVNCTAIPDTLFESEMFGIEKGVATGVNSRKGLIEESNGGTLFLDELADMSLPNQAKILRVLEEREVVRLGSSKPIPVDINIIAATNVHIEQCVKKGTFREDLYYRINVVEITLPPLNQRDKDILLLAHNFLKKHCKRLQKPLLTLSQKTQNILLTYPWPGNVRELNNEMERAAALTVGDTIEPTDLSPRINAFFSTSIDNQKDDSTASKQETFNLQDMERRLILKVLQKTDGNKSRTAEILGITREGLRKKLIRLDIKE